MNKILVYLIKDGINEYTEIVKPNAQIFEESDSWAIYYQPSFEKKPDWMKNFFCYKLENANIMNSNARVLLLHKIKVSDDTERIFAIPFGTGRFLLMDDVLDERFGLKVLLNTIIPDKFRCITKAAVGGTQKLSKEQLPKVSSINDFEYDIERDLINGITAISDYEIFEKKTVSGSDSLSVHTKSDINGMESFLIDCYKKFIDTSYLRNFSWIDQIRHIKDKTLIGLLDTMAIKKINEVSPEFYMAIPEIIDWENVDYFSYCGKKESDIFIEKVISIFNINELTNIGQIKKIKIKAMGLTEGYKIAEWNAYRCLYGEMNFDGKTYCLSDSKWYEIDSNFVNAVNNEYNNTPIFSYNFPVNNNEREGDYNKRAANEDNSLICMDAENITYGGGYSKIELCDLIGNNKTLYYVKPYSGSSTLSHLFNQAMVSGELLINDIEFRKKAAERIDQLTNDTLFKIDSNFDTNKYNIVFAIIHSDNTQRPKIPFFSKVAFKYTKKRLTAFGYKVFIKTITKVIIDDENAA